MTPLQADITVMSLAAGADIASTEYALHNCSQCIELNPLMRNTYVSIGAKTATTALAVITADKLRKSGHKGWAKVVRYGILSICLGVAIHNMKVGMNGSTGR